MSRLLLLFFAILSCSVASEEEDKIQKTTNQITYLQQQETITPVETTKGGNILIDVSIRPGSHSSQSQISSANRPAGLPWVCWLHIIRKGPKLVYKDLYIVCKFFRNHIQRSKAFHFLPSDPQQADLTVLGECMGGLNNVNILDLSETPVVDVSRLGNVYNLMLRECKSIRDFTGLGTVTILDLSGTNITDVSLLGNVLVLTLRRCANITDVSALGRVQKLILTDCLNVSDVSALGNVPSLDLSGTNVTDVSKLTHVKILKLDSTMVTDVSQLGQLEWLSLSYCSNVHDVSALGYLLYLNLSYCRQVTDASGLGSVATLNLSGTSVKDVTGLGKVKKLVLKNCQAITDISGLVNVEELYLEGCQNIPEEQITDILTKNPTIRIHKHS